MESLDKVTLETFLPLSRMRELAKSANSMYRSAKPFPHVVLDDFFDPAILETVLTEFPTPGQLPWRNFNNEYENKLFYSAEAAFGPVTRLLLYHLNSMTFLEFMSQVTGVANLIPDPGFDGGGLHQIERGGKLGIHADFNSHKRYQLDRRLNVLIYLNKDWREEYGGHLELWDRNMTRCEVKAPPVFNRMVVFSTTDFTYHGHPDPLQCPQGMTRKSLALYYYTNGRPAEEVSGKHSTLFRARREGEFVRAPWSERLRRKLKKRWHKLRWYFRGSAKY
jgi:Rps23 Pro-64 3,4-dihydroxylase Tpa1-like proline 4-hydroxylase